MSRRAPFKSCVGLTLLAVGMAGTMLAASPAAADTVTYAYDNLGRVISVYDATTGVTITYTYDLNGNRLLSATTAG